MEALPVHLGPLTYKDAPGRRALAHLSASSPKQKEEASYVSQGSPEKQNQ